MPLLPPTPSSLPSPRFRAPHVCLVLTALFSAVVPQARAADEHDKMVVQYVGNQQGQEQGKKVMLVAVRPYGSKAPPMVLAVPNKDDKKPEYDPIDPVAKAVKTLKADDFVEVEMKPSQNKSQKPVLSSIKPYKLTDGEQLPNVYVFQNNARQEEAGKQFIAVILLKLGETTTAAVPTVKNESGGGSAPDPKMIAALDAMKAGTLVEVTFGSKGKIPAISTIDPYAPPEPATFVKSTEAEIDGQKADAVELTVKGKPVTAILTGKVANKKWVVDSKLASMAKRLKPDQAIEARLVTEGDKTYLRYFSLDKEKPAAKESAAKKEKDADKKEGDNKKEPEKKEPEKKEDKK